MTGPQRTVQTRRCTGSCLPAADRRHHCPARPRLSDASRSNGAQRSLGSRAHQLERPSEKQPRLVHAQQDEPWRCRTLSCHLDHQRRCSRHQQPSEHPPSSCIPPSLALVQPAELGRTQAKCLCRVTQPRRRRSMIAAKFATECTECCGRRGCHLGVWLRTAAQPTPAEHSASAVWQRARQRCIGAVLPTSRQATASGRSAWLWWWSWRPW